MFCPQSPGKTTGKISHSPIYQGLILCNIYLPMVIWWIAYVYTNNENPYVLCYVMDLKLIDVINVSYMFYRSYLLQILPAFSKWIVKWKESRKTKDSWFRWQMEAGLAIWGGQNILPYIIGLLGLLGPFSKIWEYAKEISGNSQGQIVPHL